MQYLERFRHYGVRGYCYILYPQKPDFTKERSMAWDRDLFEVPDDLTLHEAISFVEIKQTEPEEGFEI